MAAFEPTLSTSAFRTTLQNADPPSAADSLPSINFGFDDLRARMAQFTTRFDEFIEQGRKRVLEERNQFRMNVTELKEDQRMKKKDIEILRLKSSTHEQTLQKEKQEVAELQGAISNITTQRDGSAIHCERIRQQINETQKLISQRLEAQKSHALYLDSQERFNGPELDFWQDHLCLRIEGAGIEDRIKFVFSHLDDNDWEKKGWVELDLGKREYEVLHCRPKLDSEKVDKVVEQLNETRELRLFLKGMRELFVATVES
ncbi:MAG: kinetochore-associated Ndc80 complex subunit spc25 [Vezdaea aestivalis]|nr:MAG: kinetochore-associated Ndc80 complex subunit spc25 [Vezdaea aestivalis]